MSRHYLKSELDYVSSKEVANQIIELKELTGIVTTADFLAAGIMKHLQLMGKRLPDDYSIVGFDDIALAKLTTPALTTVQQDITAKGSFAVEMMLSLLKGEPPSKSSIRLSTKLILRDSVQKIRLPH